MENITLMTESLEKVEHIKQIPIYAASSVVYLPFEKHPLKFGRAFQLQMLKDALHENQMLGVSFFKTEEKSAPDRPPAGSLGTTAQIKNVKLSKGGGKIAKTEGVARFRILEYIETEKPYPVALVEFFKDDVEPAEDLLKLSLETEAIMQRIVDKTARAIGRPAISWGHIQPTPLSFVIPDLFMFGTDSKELFLKMRLTSERLLVCQERLLKFEEACDDIDQRAEFVRRYNTNVYKPNLG